MWIFTRDSFVSISEHPEESRLLQVRARIEGDIERLFPEAQVVETPEEDYRYRTAISRDRAAQAIALRLTHIDYQSISGSIEDAERWSVYVQILTAMQEEQQRRVDRNLQLEREIPNYDLDAKG